MKTQKLAPAILIILLFIACMPMNAQIDKMKDLMDDEMTEVEDGLATLRFFDALTGAPVDNATIAIEGIGDFTTDGLGRVRFESPENDAVYAFKFLKEGYITSDFSFEVIVGTIFYNRFTVSPIIDMGSIRIVLEWDSRPSDLDLHLQKTGGYHISFHDKVASNDGMARLDLDAMHGYGPETITIKNVDDNAEYLCYVHDYSNKNHAKSKALSKAKARILVYGEGQLLHIYEINEVQRGNKWNVFRLVDGQFVVENEVKKVR
jgi:hypothetical protein